LSSVSPFSRYVGQLSKPEQKAINTSLRRFISGGVSKRKLDELKEHGMLTHIEEEFYTLNVGKDFLVLFVLQGDTLIVVDIFPTRQIKKLHSTK
jgi:hypothetical protein